MFVTLNSCAMPKQALRDGYTGPNAHIVLPGYGIWFASGQSYAWNQTVAQNHETVISGQAKPNTFSKGFGQGCCK